MPATSAGRGLAMVWLLAALLAAAYASDPDPMGPGGAADDGYDGAWGDEPLLAFDGGGRSSEGASSRRASSGSAASFGGLGGAVAAWARPGRLLAAVGLGGGAGEEDGSPPLTKAAVGNATVLAASAGCMSCCSDNPDCSHAYMNSNVGHCCVKEPATCCPSYARCAMNGCMRNTGPTRNYYGPAHHHSSSGGGFLLVVIILVALCCLCGACGGMAAGGPAMGGGMMGGPMMGSPGMMGGPGMMAGPGMMGGGWGGGGYSGGAVAGAGGAGFLGGLGMGMLLEDALDRPNYGYGGGYGGGEMYSMQGGGGESWMPADGGGGGDIMADGGGGGDF